MLISSRMGLEIANETAQELDFIKYVFPVDVIYYAIQEIHENDFVPTKYDNSDTCVVLFSSGTSGLPKGVELTHKSLFLVVSILKLLSQLLNTNCKVN